MTLLATPDTSSSLQRGNERIRLLTQYSMDGILRRGVSNDNIADLLEAFGESDADSLVNNLRRITKHSLDGELQIPTLAGLNIARGDFRLDETRAFGDRLLEATRVLRMAGDCVGITQDHWREGVSKIVAHYEEERLT